MNERKYQREHRDIIIMLAMFVACVLSFLIEYK